MIERVPIRFAPYLKSVIWGGDKICSYKGIVQHEPRIGESWEISSVPGHESIVCEGKYEGRSIVDLIDEFGPELLGEKVFSKFHGKFPLLIKFIDAADNLSVQVHPDDELALKRHNSLGKTEMWYIVDSEPKAKIYAGLNKLISPEEYVRLVEDGEFESALATHDSHTGDVFFLPAGRVHAIGAGNLLAEIQESSDITYRIFDYNRRDASGNTRELHTDLAKDAIDYNVYDDYKSAPVADDIADAQIVNCDHFKVRRIIVDGNMSLNLNFDSFTVIICIKGEIHILAHRQSTIVNQGQTVLCPAIIHNLVLEGKGTLIISHL